MNGDPTMAGVTEGRQVAASVLREVGRGRRIDLALEASAGGLEPRDRHWVHELTYGVVRLRGRVDHLLGLHLHRGLESVSPRVLDLLRMGAYQLLYMGGVPPYAAISQTVDQVRDVAGEGLGRMANGVLRSLGREGGGPERFPALDSDPVGHLSTWGSHPDWLIRRWLGRWNPTEVTKLTEWNNTPPPLYVRPLGISLETAARRLQAEGWTAEIPPGGVPCLRLLDGTNPAPLLQDFPGIVQDPGAALVTVYADPPPGVEIVDLCAAPGGKALALAGNGAYVLAADRSLPRMRLLERNLARVGGRMALMVADARRPPLTRASFVLLDVPCSGTGTLRRHPDARWRLTPEILERLVALQNDILAAAAVLIPQGGHLVYSTCTLEEEENEGQVGRFLAAHPEFVLESTGAVEPAFLGEGGCLRVTPHQMGFDGAYAARFVRAA